MNNKHFMLVAAVAAAMTLAGCGTQVLSLPLGPVAAKPAVASDVAVYFGSQAHPAVAHKVGEASHSVRVSRVAGGRDASCDKALANALDALRADARNRGANAVINVKTRFHSTENDSPMNYTCGVSPSAAAIAVRGDLVVLSGQ